MKTDLYMKWFIHADGSWLKNKFYGPIYKLERYGRGFDYAFQTG